MNETIVWTGHNQIEMSDFIGSEDFWHDKESNLLIKQDGDEIILKKGGVLVKSKTGKVYLPLSQTSTGSEKCAYPNELQAALNTIERRISERLNFPSLDQTNAHQAISLLRFWSMPLQNDAEALGFDDYLGGFIRPHFDTPECEKSWQIGFLKAHQVDNSKCKESIDHAEKLLALQSDNRPEVSFHDVIEQRKREGKPIIIIEPQTTSEELVSSLRKCLPEDAQDQLTLINLKE